MRKIVIGAALAALTLSAPIAARAQILQGTANGAQQGADQGNAAAGPLGGIVGGAVGAGVGAATGAVGTATGIVGGVFGANDEPRFHDIRVGTVLPRGGVRLYPVPDDFRIDRRYRYAVVNDQTVIVDPRTRRVVQVID